MTDVQRNYLRMVAGRSRRSLDDVVELWNERAAMREYEAGMPRSEAEQLAMDDVADVVLR